MELHVSEMNNSQNYEQIPENMPPKMNVVKRASRVHFEDAPVQALNRDTLNQPYNQTIKPSISGVKARMVRPNVPAPKPKISYDDILNKLGMFVAEGKLHLLDGQQQVTQSKPVTNGKPVSNTKSVTKSQRQETPVIQDPNPNQNSYIFNKYFQNNNYQPQPQRPLTPLEYRDMLIQNIIQKHKIKQMKSTKLVMPNSNINFAPGPTANMNKLFGFSER
jgi:hypothetical protein